MACVNIWAQTKQYKAVKVSKYVRSNDDGDGLVGIAIAGKVATYQLVDILKSMKASFKKQQENISRNNLSFVDSTDIN